MAGNTAMMYKQGMRKDELKKNRADTVNGLPIVWIAALLSIRYAADIAMDTDVQMMSAILSTAVEFPPGIIFTKLKNFTKKDIHVLMTIFL